MTDARKCMRCIPLELRRLDNPKFGWKFDHYGAFIQPKLNGFRCEWDVEEGKLYSSTLHIIESVPHINEELESIREILLALKITRLDGELYRHGMDFPTIESICSRDAKNIHPDYHEMEYHLFDLAQEGLAQFIRLGMLNLLRDHLTARVQHIWVVENDEIKTSEEVQYFYEKYIALNYEGVIVRSYLNMYERKRSLHVMKFKPKQYDVYEIVRIDEAISKDGIQLQMVGGIVMRDEEGEIFGVGPGTLKHHERRTWWEKRNELIGQRITIKYQAKTPRGVPCFGLVASSQIMN